LETGAAEVIISVAGGAMIAPKIKRPLFQLKARILSVVSPNRVKVYFLAGDKSKNDFAVLVFQPLIKLLMMLRTK